MKNIVPISYFFLFLFVFLSYTRKCYVPIYPGFFILQTAGSILVLHWLYTAWHKGVRIHPLMVWTSLFLFWCLFSSFWACHYWIVGNGMIRILIFWSLCFGLVHCFILYPKLRDVVWHLTLSGIFILALIYVIWIIIHDFDIPGRFGLPFANPNLGGTILGIGCVVACGNLLAMLQWKSWKKSSSHIGSSSVGSSSPPGSSNVGFFCLNGMMALFFLFAMLLCGSKGAFLSLFLALAVLLLCLLPWRYVYAMIGIGLVSICLLCLCLHAFPYVSEKLVNAAWPSLEIRLFAWNGTWAMIFATPWRFLFGWGPGNFFPNFPDFQDSRIFACAYSAEIIDYPHNFFLEIMAEHGIVGLALFIVMTGLVLWNCRQSLRHSVDISQRIHACAVFGVVMLLIFDAQLSISFSYPQTQFFMALAIAWTCGENSHLSTPSFASSALKARPSTMTTTSPTSPSFSCTSNVSWFSQGQTLSKSVCRVLLIAMVPLYAFLWKYYGWDYLLFHVDYKKARKAAEKERVASMLSVTPPIFENFYTIQWRSELGSCLVDVYEENPILVQESISPFLWLENTMPKFGYFWIYKAILLSKQGKSEEAEKYFILAAQKNPFSHHLWVWWGFACKNGDANISTMLRTVLYHRSLHPDDGGILAGEALSRHLAGDTKTAAILMEKVQNWVKEQSARRPTQRLHEIGLLAAQYLKKSQK